MHAAGARAQASTAVRHADTWRAWHGQTVIAGDLRVQGGRQGVHERQAQPGAITSTTQQQQH